MACTVERLRQAARNVPVVLLLGRLKNSAWVGSIPPVLLALSRATSAERARARSVLSPVHARWPEKQIENIFLKPKIRIFIFPLKDF